MNSLRKRAKKSLTFDITSVNELIEYCKQEFNSAINGRAGSSIRAQLENVWQQTGIKPKELENLIELKQSQYELWSWFMELNESRTSTGFGMNPISYSDIFAYFNLQGITPHKWEVDTLRRLDREVLSIYAKKAQADSKKKS